MIRFVVFSDPKSKFQRIKKLYNILKNFKRMEVKREAVDQSYETTSISMIEMNEKFVKLQQEFVVMKKEMAELRKENAEMKEKMTRNNEKYKRQNALVKEIMAKLKVQNHQHRGLEMQQQSQMPIMDNMPNTNNTNDYPIEKAQNEFGEILMMADELNQQEEQNVENNTFDFVENLAATIIKQEYGNAEIERANFPIQMQTSSSSNLNNCQENDNQQNGLEKFFVGVEEFQNIECAPIKIGGMLKCNWPGCEFRSLYPYNMQTHWRTHTGERPFVCEECGQSFSHSSTLKRHSLIHTGQKPYQCNVCGKSFRKSSQLSIHVRNHTGENPFLCMECDKSFKSNTGLQKHRQIHHEKYCK